MRILSLLCSILLLSLSLLPLAASANLSIHQDEEKRWQSQRAAYRNALTLLDKGQRSQYQAETEKLRDYPLYPDLKYREYSRYIANVSKQEVDAFIARFGDSVLALRLRQQWIQMQADKKDWKTYLTEYRPGQYGVQFDCQYYWGQYKTGSRDEAFAGARKLWLVGSSQHKACDPLFGVWKTTSKIDGALAWERTRLAMDKQEYQLASNLESYLPKQQQAMSREWRELARNPQRLKDISRYRAWGDDAKPLLITGLARLIRKDSALALKLWPVYAREFAFNEDEKRIIVGDFAFILGANQEPMAEHWLSQAAQYEGNQHLAPLAVRTALRDRDWQRARRWLALMNEEDSTSSEWRYWTARANGRVGPIDPANMPRIRIDRHQVDVFSFHQRYLDALFNRNETFVLFPTSVLQHSFAYQPPEDTLRSLAGERSYYGFMASERLQQPLSLNLMPSQVTEEELRAMARQPGMLRARELFLMGEVFQSRVEWHHMITRMNADERSIAAHLAYMWEWHNPAILAAAQSSAYDNLEIRFPIAFNDEVLKQANQQGLDPDWVYSLIRQESAFMPAARSPVGALGMMQIMPGTAKMLSRSMGIAVPSQNDLLTPATNIRMGTFFLKQLKDQFDGNIVLATAAYNAGPGRAKAWQPKYAATPGDIWIETIPYKETREYVKNIVTYQAIYRHLLGRDVSLSHSVAAIPPKVKTVTAGR